MSLPKFTSVYNPKSNFASLRPRQSLTYDGRAHLMMVHNGRMIPVYVGTPIEAQGLTIDLECETVDISQDLELV